jgi:hypothetical protein
LASIAAEHYEEVLERLLKLTAVLLSVIVAMGWLLFAVDETSAASKLTATEVAGQEAVRQPDPTPDEERAREATHGDLREGIDDANDVLLKPFASVVATSDSKWVRRSVPALLGLVLYGFLLGFVARYARGLA